MFYNYTVNLYKKGETIINDYGVAETGEDILLNTFNADLQPYSKEMLQREYGVDIVCTKRMFCDFLDDIKVGRLIEYNNKKYEIVTLVEWTYLDCALKEV